jgi:TRAP-type C4-dicarboxylate transport system permease small subunit
MKGSSTGTALLKGLSFFLKGVKWAGYVSLSGVILLTTINVFGRYILRRPLLGEYDMVELGMAIFGGIGMLIAAMERHHVSVDVLLIRLSRRVQRGMGRFASLLGFVTWCLIAYLAFRDGLERWKNGSCSATLQIPQGPFEILLSVSLFLFSLTLLTQVFRPEGPKKEKEGGPQA